MSPHCILWYGMELYFIRSYCMVSHCYVRLLQRTGELPRSASSHFPIHFSSFLRLRRIDQSWRSIRPSVIGQKSTTQISWRFSLFWSFLWMDGHHMLANQGVQLNWTGLVHNSECIVGARIVINRLMKGMLRSTNCQESAFIKSKIHVRKLCLVITRRRLWCQFQRSLPSKDSFSFSTATTPFHTPLSLSSLRFDIAL